jgi:micrococcal nuclease
MFLIRIGFVALAGLLPAALTFPSADRLPGPYDAAVERVVDGDTIAVRVTVWLGLELAVSVRVRGIDAPELRGDCESEKARAAQATAALARMIGDEPVTLRSIEGDKYFGRVLSDVATARGEDVAAALLAAGLARPYDGGERPSWCQIGALPVGREELARITE